MGRLVYITRRERFNAAHKLWNPEWSEEKNKELFGGCANPNWHGHNYELFITVKGVPDADTGYFVNLKDLSKILKEKVIKKLDHKNLNLDVEFMKDKMASTENLAVAVWDEIVDDISSLGGTLHCVRITESENNSAEYYGE